jgi:hypothetical protein
VSNVVVVCVVMSVVRGFAVMRGGVMTVMAVMRRGVMGMMAVMGVVVGVLVVTGLAARDLGEVLRVQRLSLRRRLLLFDAVRVLGFGRVGLCGLLRLAHDSLSPVCKWQLSALDL